MLRHLCILVCLGGALCAGEAARTGSYQTQFTEHHPESNPARLVSRNGWALSKAFTMAKGVIDLAKEEYDVYVPKSYDGSVAYGLIAYVNSGKGGAPPGEYRSLLDKHRLIWVGACSAQNDRPTTNRIALTLDAVWNMRKLYRIDSRRLYTSGLSGGGRVASMLAPAYAEVFSGGIFQVGCNTPVYPVLPNLSKQVKDLAVNNRYALMTGSKDFNRQDTKDVYDNLKSQGYKHIDYFEEPGLEHHVPSAE